MRGRNQSQYLSIRAAQPSTTDHGFLAIICIPNSSGQPVLSLTCSIVHLGLTLYSPMDCSLPGYSVHGNPPGKNTGMGYHFLLKRIFLTQVQTRVSCTGRWLLLSHIISSLLINSLKLWETLRSKLLKTLVTLFSK